jgi:outer membrane protein OmpA-like peptidoglycan-associated protein
MFRWPDLLLATAGAVIAVTGVASAHEPIVATAPVIDMALTTTTMDLPITSIDGAMSIHRTRVILQSDVLFAFDSATLSTGAQARIRAVSRVLDLRRPRTITIDGYTDARGSAAYNMRLSLRRAEEVRASLAHEVTTPDVSVRAEGRGETSPMASNRNAVGRALNRRVEIRFR